MKQSECCKKNFLKKISTSFVESVGRISKDPTLASSEIVEERLKVCQNCDRLNESLGICKECGCIVKLKTKFAAVECPLGKW